MNLKAFLAAVTAVFLCAEAGAQSPKAGAVGGKYIDFEAVQTDGASVRLSDFVGNGKYVLVDFWASWCGPCREEMATLKDIWHEFKGDDFDIVGAPVFDKKEKTLQAVDELKIPWKQLLSVPDSVSKAYGFNYIPFIILVGPDGTILGRDLRGDDLWAAVKKYVKKK